ncbi:MAG: Rrf2 family transcriptional regulator [Zetaproteobacteria bacterium]|nr:MAG: Rrf2 family transcriptional regulator [Zetaproteobacteria bacterium]
MQISQFADYAIRILIYLALEPDRRVRLRDIADAYGVSYNHLVKIVGAMSRHQIVDARRGRNGGVLLCKEPAEINVGYIVRAFEPSLDLLECFDPATNTCPIAPVCRGTGLFRQAREAFLSVLDRYTIADVVAEQGDAMRRLLKIESPMPAPEKEGGVPSTPEG